MLLEDLLTRAGERTPQSMLFIEGTAEMEESHTDLKTQLGCLQQELESNGLHISREKWVHDYLGGGGWQTEEVLLSQPLKEVEEFKYLRSVFQNNVDINADATHRIRGPLW